MKDFAKLVAAGTVGYLAAAALLNILAQVDATRELAEFFQRGNRG